MEQSIKWFETEMMVGRYRYKFVETDNIKCGDCAFNIGSRDAGRCSLIENKMHTFCSSNSSCAPTLFKRTDDRFGIWIALSHLKRKKHYKSSDLEKELATLLLG